MMAILKDDSGAYNSTLVYRFLFVLLFIGLCASEVFGRPVRIEALAVVAGLISGLEFSKVKQQHRARTEPPA